MLCALGIFNYLDLFVCLEKLSLKFNEITFYLSININTNERKSIGFELKKELSSNRTTSNSCKQTAQGIHTLIFFLGGVFCFFSRFFLEWRGAIFVEEGVRAATATRIPLGGKSAPSRPIEPAAI